jgi:uncharacterized Zn finger protein
LNLKTASKTNLVPLSNSKIKCPRCKVKIPKYILQKTGGRCNNCGYLIANSVEKFLKKSA